MRKTPNYFSNILHCKSRSICIILLNLIKIYFRDELQVVASGHCTFTKAQKEENKNDFTKIPQGINGVEDRMKIVWEQCVASNLFDLHKFVKITSVNAAKIFNLYPRKGCIAVGSDADIVIWNHQVNQTITAKNNNQVNIFEGTKITGAPEIVIVKGKVVFEDENLRVAEGYGKCLELPSHCPQLYSFKNGGDNHDLVDALDQQLDRFQVEFEDRDYVPEKAESMKSTNTQATFTSRAPRPDGQRDMQSSSFSISKGRFQLLIIFLITNEFKFILEISTERNKSCIKVHAQNSTGFW